MDEAWARLHATRPDVKRVDIAVSIRPDLLTGNPSQLGDQVVELARKDFLKHGGVLIYNDYEYTMENILRVAANSLGGIHWGPTNWDQRSEELRQYMEGSVWFGRPLPAAMIAEIARCTLRACKPLADELTRLGLYSSAFSEWMAGGRPLQCQGSTARSQLGGLLAMSLGHLVTTHEFWTGAIGSGSPNGWDHLLLHARQ